MNSALQVYRLRTDPPSRVAVIVVVVAAAKMAAGVVASVHAAAVAQHAAWKVFQRCDERIYGYDWNWVMAGSTK